MSNCALNISAPVVRTTYGVVISALLILSIHEMHAQTGERSGSFGIGARATSLADAYATEYTDVLSLFWNPASLGFLERKTLAFDYFNGIHPDLSMATMSIPLRLTNDDVIGFGLTAMQVGVDEGNGSVIRGTRYGLNFASAKLLTSTLSFGARVALQHGQTSDSKLWTASSVLGVMYSPSPEISYALVYSGLGFGMQHSYDLQAAERLTFSKVSLPATLYVGLAMRYPSSRVERTLTIALANEKVFGEPGIIYKGALEVNANKFLALRMGYVAAPTTASPRYGVGVFLGRFQLDYAYAGGHGVQRFHEFTLSISLGGDKRIAQ